MLHAQPDGRERILDLVRDLTRHFTPRQNSLCAGYLDPAQLEIAGKASGRNAAEPQRRERAGRSREKYEHPEVAPASIQNEVIAASGRREDVPLLSRSKRRAVPEQHFGVAEPCLRGG